MLAFIPDFSGTKTPSDSLFEDVQKSIPVHSGPDKLIGGAEQADINIHEAEHFFTMKTRKNRSV